MSDKFWWRQYLLAIFVAASAALLLLRSASAAAVYWDGGTDFNWMTAANWSGGHAPGYSDDAVLDESPYGSSYTVVVPSTFTQQNQSVNSLTIDATSGLNIAGNELFITTASSIAGTLTLSGGILNPSGAVNVSGTFNFTAGTLLGSGETTIQSAGTVNFNSTTSDILDGNFENDGSISSAFN